MTTAAALISQQPAVFWLAVVGGALAAAIASGRPMAIAAALGPGLGAVFAAFLPHAPGVQAAAALIGTAAAPAADRLRRGPRARGEAADAAPTSGDTRLLGRTARTCSPFIRGEGDVEVDGRSRAARCLSPDEFVGAGVLVLIVRVGEAALVVRPLEPSAG